MRNYCIIGSGRQGTAAAYDIIKFGRPSSLTIIDFNDNSLERCHKIIKKLTNYNIKIINLDINNSESLIKALNKIDIFLSSVPYPLNPYLTDIAIESKQAW